MVFFFKYYGAHVRNHTRVPVEPYTCTSGTIHVYQWNHTRVHVEPKANIKAFTKPGSTRTGPWCRNL